MNGIKRLLASVSSAVLLLAGIPGPRNTGLAQEPAGLEGTGAPIAGGFVQTAQLPVGLSDVVERDVRGTYGGSTRALVINDDVFFEEIIETEADSAARILFRDDTSLTLGPSSQVVLDRFVYDPATSTGELAVDLIGGVFRFTSGTMPDSSYRIRTPVATIGIRGTELDIIVQCIAPVGADCDDHAVIVDVRSGTVAAGVGGQSLLVRAGQRLSVPPAGLGSPTVEPIPPASPPPAPVAATQQLLDAAMVRIIEAQLPPGVTLATASLDQLLAALEAVLRTTPSLADLAVLTAAGAAPQWADQIITAAATYAPQHARRVAEAATTLALAVPAGGFVQPAAGTAADIIDFDQS